MKIPDMGPVKGPNINGAFIGAVVGTLIVSWGIRKLAKAVGDNTSGVVRNVAETVEEVAGG